jgi:hypothetical protein
LAIEAASVSYRARSEFSHNRTESDASGIDRLAPESDSATIKLFGDER